MFDEIILFFYTYGLWVVLVMAVFNLIHIVVYTHGNPVKTISRFFVIYSGKTMIDVRSHRKRYRFRKIHNLLVTFFYVFLLTWVTLHLIFYYDIPGENRQPEDNKKIILFR